MTASERRIVRALGGAAAVLALLAAAVGTPTRGPAAPASVGARQLAQWIRENRPGLRVLDLRGDSAFAAGHIPSAEPVALARLEALALGPTETVVLYSGDPAKDSLARRTLSAPARGKVLLLRGGARAWAAEVLAPEVSGDSAAYVAALSRYFGGRPRTGDAVRPVASDSTTREGAGEGERATDVFGIGGRRGC